jgi:hypothetical protein
MQAGPCTLPFQPNPLQEVAAEGHPRAVAGGEEEILLRQRRQQLVAAAAGTGNRGHRFRIDRHRVEPGDVEQHAAVANVVAGPAVPAGAHADLHSLGARQAHRLDQILGLLGPHDQVRIARRRAGIPDGIAARLLIAVLAPEQFLGSKA